MKEILFRGKTKSGRWVYGSLILAGTYCCILEREEDVHPTDYPYLYDSTGTIDGRATPVIPETVGRLLECPGYNSFSGSRYFEGDIIEIKPRKGDCPQIHIAICVDNNSITENGLGRWFPQDIFEATVIGNVHDNPDLDGKKYADLYKLYHCLEVGNENNNT